MYSTKQIEKILLASRKPLLARRIEYLNKQQKSKNIMVLANDDIAPDTMFLYYYKRETGLGIDGDNDNTFKIFGEIYQILRNEYNVKYFPDTTKFFKMPFAFIIDQQNKVIMTTMEKNRCLHHNNFPNMYTNQDTKKILKDLVKNGIISEDYRLRIGDTGYSVKDILSNKNTPIKYSRRGNPLMYHGTSMDNWEEIKKSGGLRPREYDEKNDYDETILESLVYLTASFNIAKGYANKTADGVVLLVEVPDINQLFVDTGYMESNIIGIINKISAKDFETNNKDIQAFRKHLIWNNTNHPYLNGLKNKISVDEYTIDTFTFAKAIIDEDFSVIERYFQKHYKRLSNEEKDLLLQQIHDLYNVFVKYFKSLFNSPKALRQSINNIVCTKNAVAYHGRIPLSYIHGVFDLDGKRIE